MPAFLLAQKSIQTQMFDDEGKRIPVTELDASTCHLIDYKTVAKDGYASVKLGAGSIKNIKKPQEGELKKAGIKASLRFFREIRLTEEIQEVEEEGKKGIMIGETKFFIGDKLNPSLFLKKGDIVDVTGTSIGKGFQGVVRRHGFRGGPKTHGQSDRERAPGSMGQTTTPGRVYKGKRMAGRMGGVTVTVRNLEVVSADENKVVVKGLVPGCKSALLEVSA
ncbi:50S ribosomal protein L3 [Candidatus Roizmanbacteria bacterium]|nr:50S ribosomal protein L3 [Candidatus Roizmanbacteria bacterium]